MFEGPYIGGLSNHSQDLGFELAPRKRYTRDQHFGMEPRHVLIVEEAVSEYIHANPPKITNDLIVL